MVVGTVLGSMYLIDCCTKASFGKKEETFNVALTMFFISFIPLHAKTRRTHTTTITLCRTFEKLKSDRSATISVKAPESDVAENFGEL